MTSPSPNSKITQYAKPVELTHQAGRFFELMPTDRDRCRNCGAPFMDHTNGTCPAEARS